MTDEDYLEEEYITNENDPHRVEKITEEDYTIAEKEEKIEFDEIFKTVKTVLTNLTNHDHMMNEKVLDALRKGTLK